MEADYIALSTALKDLIPFQCLLKIVSKGMGLVNNTLSTIRTIVWKYNQGCLILANLEHPRMISRSKDYSLKYHWFRVQLKPNNILIRLVSTTDQLVDIYYPRVYDVYFLNSRIYI